MSFNSVIPIEPEELRKLLDADTCILIDVREEEEFSAVHISGARLFPLSSFREAPLPDKQGKLFVFVCAVGRRSLMAAEYAAREKRISAASLNGGLQAWINLGFPVETG